MCLGADGVISAVLSGESKAKGKCFALITVVVIIEKCGKAATLIASDVSGPFFVRQLFLIHEFVSRAS